MIVWFSSCWKFSIAKFQGHFQLEKHYKVVDQQVEARMLADTGRLHSLRQDQKDKQKGTVSGKYIHIVLETMGLILFPL